MQPAMPLSAAGASAGEVVALERHADPDRATIGVLLAHEAGLARAGLRVLLERDAAIAVSGEASRGEDVIALAGELVPTVVLLDVRLPDVDAQQVAGIVAAAPEIKLVMLSSWDSDDELFAYVRAGASGFVLSDAGPAELLRVIHGVALGHVMLSPCLTRRLIDEFAAQPDRHRPVPERLEELTAREREVMALAAVGLSNHEIAQRLVVSPATAKTHVSRAMRKLHARNRAQLVTLAYQAGLVEPCDHRPPTPTFLAAA